jgi:hypothetical protein
MTTIDTIIENHLESTARMLNRMQKTLVSMYSQRKEGSLGEEELREFKASLLLQIPEKLRALAKRALEQLRQHPTTEYPLVLSGTCEGRRTDYFYQGLQETLPSGRIPLYNCSNCGTTLTSGDESNKHKFDKI